MAEPNEEDIRQFVEISGGFGHGEDRNVVVQALKSNNNEVMRAINEWFEDANAFQTKYRQRWDESMFGGERDAPQQDPQSYHVERPYQDSDIIEGVPPSQSAAPSRPPSRTNGTPMDRVTDWATETAGVPDRWDQDNNWGQNTGVAQGDDDLEKALQASREQAVKDGIEVPPQESGVTGTNATGAAQFGPATREYYEEAQWGMVPSSAVEHSFWPSSQVDVPPSKRERKMGAPAFVVDVPDRASTSRLGAYLTIIHSIPLARNMYLRGAPEDVNYGHDPQWWKGELISRPHSLNESEDGELEWQNVDPAVEVRDELRRLMAFMDSTTRSYAVAEALSKLRPHLDDESEFHKSFEQFFPDEETLTPFFTRIKIEAAGEEDDGSMDDSSTETSSDELVHSFEIHPSRQNYSGVTNLYGLLDTVMWQTVLERTDEPLSKCHLAWIGSEGDVFAINFCGEGPSTSIDIPETFYRERWFPSRREEASKIMSEMVKLKKEEDAATQAKMKVWQAPGLGDPRSFLKAVKERFDHHRDYLHSLARFRTVEESDFDEAKYPDYHQAPYNFTDEEKALDAKLEEAARAAEKTLDDGRRRAEAINEELERIQKKRRFLSLLLTDPDKKGRPKPMTCKKFLLQGIATSNNIVYVCKRAQENLIEFSNTPQQRDQWWRLEFNPQDTEEPVKTEMLDFETIHEKMWKENKKPLLVYASEAAARASPTPLPSALERFVKADNKAFAQELNQETHAREADEQAEVPSTAFSPTKRKHRGSMDSMNSNRPEAGSVDGNVSDDPFPDTGSRNTSPSRAQKRVSPGASSPPGYDREQGGEQQKPPLPRRPESTEQPSTRQTSREMNTPETQQTTPLPVAELGSKAPEMQQRPQASIFAGRDDTKEPKVNDNMDIDE